MEVAHDVPLAPLTTLGVGGPAKRLVRVDNIGELAAALDDADVRGERVLVVGGGSNLVVGDAGWNGVVIQLAAARIELVGAAGGAAGGAIVNADADAGASWDDFVARMVAAGLSGVECLSGIPGKVGATPMQNVGAYGQEVADTIAFVRAYDRERREVVKLEARDCGFGYRTSMFKGRDRWIILDVRFRLARRPDSAPIRYAELCKALGIAEGATAPLAEVRRTVLELRRGKGMVVDAADPDSRSAGSFFTNPVVDAAAATVVTVRAGAMPPQWPQGDGRVKLSAGWLIERAGFAKGTTRGHVGISRKHALALVTRDGATAAALLALAAEIQKGVRDRFGIALEPEPVIV